MSSLPEIEAPEDDAEFLNLAPPTQGVTLRLSKPLDLSQDAGGAQGGQAGNLLAVSNVFGWCAVGGNRGFSLFSLPSIRSLAASSPPHTTPELTPNLEIATPSRVDFLRFAMGEKIVLAGMRDGSVGVWRLKTLVEGNPTPSHVFPALSPSPLFDVLPNPAPASPLVVLLSPHALTLLNLKTQSPVASFPADLQATAACWSVKGKQVAVGTRGGLVAQFTPEGEKKAEIGLPPALAGQSWDVRSLHWLENNVFFVTYAKPATGPGEPPHEYEVYVITKVGGATEYARFMDPTPAFGMMEREGRRWIVRFKGWRVAPSPPERPFLTNTMAREPFKHLIFMANAPSSEIGAFGQSTHWASLALPDASRPSLPTATMVSTCPLGFEVDLSSTDPTYSGTGDERVAGPPSPHLMVYTNEGVLVVWRVGNESGAKYDGMRVSRDVLTQEDVVEEESHAAVAAPTVAPSPFAPSSSPFAVPAASPFGAPAFATPSAFATPPTSPFGAPAFGAPAAFGATGFGAPAFGGAAFGASAFGKPAAPAPVASASPAAFSAPAGGAFAAFGARSTTGFGAATPFPSSTSTSAFGTGSAFGAAATPVFGAASTPSVFGAPSAFGATAAPSAFGAATTPAAGGFGAFETTAGSTSGFGSFAPKSASPFGAAAPTSSPFGAAAAAPSPFGAPATLSAFASPSTSAFTSSGTAGFAPSPVSAAKSAFAAVSRGNESDSDQEEEMGEEEEQTRVDEPPDLEPTVTGLDIGASMANAKSSTDRTGATPATISTPSAFGAGGLSFGGFGLGTPAPATTVAPPTSIFGAAVAAGTTKAPAAIGFGFGSGAALPKPTGFSFGSSATPTPAIGTTAPTPSPFGAPVATPSTFGAPAASPLPFGSAATTPSPFAVPATSPFSTPATSPFGVTAPTPSIFGTPAVKPATPPLPPATPPTPTAATPPRSVFADEDAAPEAIAQPSPPATPSPSSPPSTSPPASTKSLFGFASSPPPSAGLVGSLIGRISSLAEEEGEEKEEGEGEEYEEGQYGEVGEYEGEESESAGEEEEDYEHGIDETFDRGDEGEEENENEIKEEPEATPAPIPSPQPTTPVATPSLFSRLAPAAASPPLSPSPTPSPSPFVPTTPRSPPPPALPAATTSALVEAPKTSAPILAKPTPPPVELPAKLAFSGFGQPATAPAPTAKAPSNFFGFTSSAPRSSSPLSMPPAAPLIAAPRPTSALAGPPAFSFAPTPTPLAVPKPAPSFSLPSAPSTPAPPMPTTPSFFAPPPPATTLPLAAPFSVAPTPTAATPPVDTPQLTPTIKTGPSLAQTTTPKVDGQFGTTPAPSVAETGMAGEFLKAFLVLQNEFEQLHSRTVVCQNFVRDIGQPFQTSTEAVTYDDRSWSLGDLDKLRELTEKADPGVKALVGSALVQKRQAAELQSLMLKAETKREEAARFIRARSDPVFAKMVRVRQLGPEQVENQKKIRLAVEAARSRIEQLEEHMIALKDRVVEERIGKSSFKTPSLDAVNRAVRNITAAITEKTWELDDLALRLDMLRVQPATPTSLSTSVLRHRPPSFTEASLSTPLKPIRAPPSPSVAATAQAALKAERSVGILKRALLAVRSTPLLNVSARGSGGATRSDALSDLQLAFAAGPITGDRLPLPRRPQPPPTPKPAFVPQATPSFIPLPQPFALPSTPSFALPSIPSFALPSAPSFDVPTPTAASPSPFPISSWKLPPPQAPAFGGLPAFKAPISITFTTPISTTTSTTSPGSSRGASKQSRTHTNAVQLRSGGEASPASTFDWGVPPTVTPTKVSNFVSFAPSPAQEVGANGVAQEDEGEYDEEDEGEGDEGSEEWSEGSEEGLDTISEAEEEE